MKKLWAFLTFALVIGLIFSGCAAKKTVERIETDTVTDLSGRWNDTDSRQVSEAMIVDCLNHPWLTRHMAGSGGKRPAVIVGSMSNRSNEHIAVRTFVNDIERAFINSGQVTVVASAGDREKLRTEKEDQRVFADTATIKQMGRELGADYMMTGEINTIVDQEGGEKVTFYQADLTLTNIESNEKVWLGQKKIKKFISRSRYSS
jgi:uncharacterized protein (TIGR02722 family)